MDFASLDALANHLDRVADRVPDAMDYAVRAMGWRMRNDARALFGHYQEGWPSLAARTVAERVKLGFTPDDPLLRSGQLRDAVTFQGSGRGQGFVGVLPGTNHVDARGKSVDMGELMAVHEHGSLDGHVPARPVFGIIDHRALRYVDTFGDRFIARIGL